MEHLYMEKEVDLDGEETLQQCPTWERALSSFRTKTHRGSPKQPRRIDLRERKRPEHKIGLLQLPSDI